MADRDPRYFDDVDPDEAGTAERPTPAAPPPERRKRVRMGQTVSGLGRKSAARPGIVDFAKTTAQRARQQQAQHLATGGKNKGERLGFGIASGRTEPPITPTPVEDTDG